MEGDILAKRRRGRPWRKWIQDVTDDLSITAAETAHLAHDREKFQRTVRVAKFCSGQAF
uniref:Uncharacterized protein n=1 Tax=Arion vulgaris TaxID=1028688 RepID=A0A0B7AYD3_9EUPU